MVSEIFATSRSPAPRGGLAVERPVETAKQLLPHRQIADFARHLAAWLVRSR
jgi:hypothetical protein